MANTNGEPDQAMEPRRSRMAEIDRLERESIKGSQENLIGPWKQQVDQLTSEVKALKRKLLVLEYEKTALSAEKAEREEKLTKEIQTHEENNRAMSGELQQRRIGDFNLVWRNYVETVFANVGNTNDKAHQGPRTTTKKLEDVWDYVFAKAASDDKHPLRSYSNTMGESKAKDKAKRLYGTLSANIHNHAAQLDDWKYPQRFYNHDIELAKLLEALRPIGEPPSLPADDAEARLARARFMCPQTQFVKNSAGKWILECPAGCTDPDHK